MAAQGTVASFDPGLCNLAVAVIREKEILMWNKVDFGKRDGRAISTIVLQHTTPFAIEVIEKYNPSIVVVEEQHLLNRLAFAVEIGIMTAALTLKVPVVFAMQPLRKFKIGGLEINEKAQNLRKNKALNSRQRSSALKLLSIETVNELFGEDETWKSILRTEKKFDDYADSLLQALQARADFQ